MVYNLCHEVAVRASGEKVDAVQLKAAKDVTALGRYDANGAANLEMFMRKLLAFADGTAVPSRKVRKR